tara:strand:- start:463 stop:831 length:369 start_codon:yes stop_codon:yes gene_type:complete
MTTKISARRIEKGMTIKVSGILDRTEQFTNMINEANGWGTHSEEEKKMYQNRLDNNDVLEVNCGTIKKDSPILKVYDIDFSNSYSYYANSRLVTLNEIKLKTDKGNVRISTRQKVGVCLETA